MGISSSYHERKRLRNLIKAEKWGGQDPKTQNWNETTTQGLEKTLMGANAIKTNRRRKIR